MSSTPPAGATSSSSWNRNNPAIRRILADVRELALDPSDQYAARPTEDNMFDWHFAIRGPAGTDFEGGVYHGRIILPSDYPFKPPSIMLLTPNGRWEVSKKICLSISAYHPEQWQPAWGIRTILEALISFMTAPADGAVGALDFTPEERRRLAKESEQYTHPLMPEIPPQTGAPGPASFKYKDEIAKMHIVSMEPQKKEAPGGPAPDGPAPDGPAPAPDGPAPAGPAPTPSGPAAAPSGPAPAPRPQRAGSDAAAEAQEGRSGDVAVRAAPAGLRRRLSSSGRPGSHGSAAQPAAETGAAPAAAAPPARPVAQRTDWLLYYAIVLAVMIFAILYRKALRHYRGEI